MSIEGMFGKQKEVVQLSPEEKEKRKNVESYVNNTLTDCLSYLARDGKMSYEEALQFIQDDLKKARQGAGSTFSSVEAIDKKF